MDCVAISDDPEDDYRQQDEREGELDVPEAHENRIPPATREPGRQSSGKAEKRSEQDREKSDDKRVAGAIHQSAGDISSECVRAQGVVERPSLTPKGWSQAVGKVLRQRVVRSQERRR